MSKLLPFVLFPFVLLVACSGGAPADEALRSREAVDFADRLARSDHRFLDALEVTPAFLGMIASRHGSLPYALGRALEGRGRRSAAITAYRFAFDAGVAPWDGFAAARIAGILRSRGDAIAAHAWGVQGTEAQRENRDLWLARGAGLYEAEEYRRLLELVAELPPTAELTGGEMVSPGDLAAEVALWRAVARYELDPDDTDGFVDAFVSVPAGPIHTRLYLYLYYRDGALQRLAPEERLLLEGVYRVARDEYSEALRLLTMIEPAAFVAFLADAAALSEQDAEASGTEHEPIGIVSTIRRALSVDRGRTAAWLSRVQEAVTDDPRTAPLAGDIAILRGVERERNAPDDALEIYRSVGGAATERYLSLRIEEGDPLEEVVAALVDIGATDAQLSRAVDRLLPTVVRDRRWEAVSEALRLVPDDAEEARIHLSYVIGLLASEGLFDAEDRLPAGDTGAERGDVSVIPLAEIARRPGFDYFAIAASALLDEPRRYPDYESVQEYRMFPAGASPPAPIGLTSERSGDPAAIALLHADALITAGQVWEALTLAMTAARAPGTGDLALRIAHRFAAYGHHSAALDLVRRVYARDEHSYTDDLPPEDIAILYPAAYAREIADAAGMYEIPVALLTGLVREESHFRRSAESWVGARGLGQLMPATAEDIARRLGLDGIDLDDPEHNLRFAAYYLSYLGEQIDQPVLRLASYNAGLGRGRQWRDDFGELSPLLQIEAIPFIETRWYVRRIAVSAAIYQWLIDGTPPHDAVSLVLEGKL
ncbi:MAG: transglycosylase SLT domain-containing protein [Alkalispirochaeta sp.]